ncbi:MAG: hypothetical protein OXB86_04470 [Bdellovibrionales bacterium]|nr:hypothetical protein [Bdellovibrionales bacterium]
MEKALEKTDSEGKSSSKELTEKTEVFDIINSKELEHLFQKNAHLLNRISTTQRRNSLLQKELFSLIEEKSKLGLKNNILNDEVSALREKISFFQDKQKQFKEQSVKLRRILNNLQLLQDRKINKEETALTKGQLKEALNKLIRYSQYREKVQKAHKNMKDLLHKKAQRIQNLESLQNDLQGQVKTLNQKDKSLQDTHESMDDRLKRKIGRIQMLESLQSDLQEQIKILNQQNKNLQEAAQNSPYQKEVEILKNNYNSLQRALAQQQEGFTAALRSCRKRHIAAMKVVAKEKDEVLKSQNMQLEKMEADLSQKEQELQSVTALRAKETDQLKQDLKTQQELRQHAEEEAKILISKYQFQLNEKEQKQEEELTKLQAQIQMLSSEKNTDHIREQEALKREYEHRIQSLTEVHEKKLKNVCTEMENDLCSEKRRIEMLTSEKEEKIKQLEQNTEDLSKEVRQLTVRNNTLEKSHQETSERLKKEISSNEKVKYQHKQVKELWQNLQTQLEKRNQQVESLQKLNRSLSIQLNERNKTSSPPPSYFPDPNQDSDIEDDSSGSASNRHPLADIHFS